MNLREKIQALCNSTTSAEVRAICESFLQSAEPAKVAETSLFESLNGLKADSQVNALLTEQENLQKGIHGIQATISKNAAANIMANWGGTGSHKTSNVGNHVNKVMIREKAQEVESEKAILEGLKKISDKDPSAQQMVSKLELASYGVSESIEALKKTNMSKHPQFKYILEKFEGYVSSNISESKIVTDYVSSISPFTWDKEVSESYNKVKSNLEGKAAIVEVQNAIFDIRNTDTRGFFSSVVEKLTNWVNNEKRNVPTLIKEMKSYQFNSIVRNLTNKLMLMENSKGTQFNVPVSGSNCTISNIYSPVTMKSGFQIFKAGNNFYAANSAGINKMSEAQVNALPKEYLELCEAFFNESVKVANDNIVVYVGKHKVTIGDSIKVNEQEVTLDTLGSTLMNYSQGTIFGSTSPMIKVAVKLAESAASIMEIDFGKAIFSNLYEGTGVYMFRCADKVYLNKVNPSMNENKFFEANGMQAVKFVKNFLSYNVSESLADLLTGDAKKKSDMEKNLGVVMNNINLLEGELNKIENAISTNPEIADVPEISAAKELVSAELNNARSSWQELNTELKKFENADEEEEGEPVEIKDEEPTEEPEGDKPAEEPVAPEGDKPAEEPASNDDVPPADDADGGVPAEPTDVPPTDGAPAASSDEVVNVGLAGAEGAQVQTQAIQGNDHIDANAAATAPAEPAAPGEEGIAPAEPAAAVVDAGFAGAEGSQTPAADVSNLADVTAVQPTSTNAEITIPDNLAPNAQDAPAVDAAPSVDPNPANAPGEEPAQEPTADAANAEGGEGAVVEPSAPDQGEEKSNEALDTNVQVKLKGSDRMGKITASNTTEHTFTVLWDDGESGDYNEDQLEEIKPESADNQADNAVAAKDAAKEVAENEQAPEGSDANAPENLDVYVKGTITIDFGPYKEGEQVEINAADYTAAGDDDPVKIKEPKEDIGTLPKKYVKIVEEAPKEEMSELQTKLESVVKNLEEIGTFIKGNDKMESKSIEEALEKLKAYSGALSKESK